MMPRLLRLCYALALLLLAALPVGAQYAPDSDGDGVSDDLDLCYAEPGPAEGYGCTAEALATFGDFDRDGVIDPLDYCYDVPGLAENAGCPADIRPDLDFDGLVDAEDRCPRAAGGPENGGCPPDADGDFVRDFEDACPAQPGTFATLGCPEGVPPPDGDGDSVADVFDLCPTQPGLPNLIGCPDADGDGVPDNVDACPGVSGDRNLVGCLPVTVAPLPALAEPITTASAARVAEVARLVVGQPHLDLNPAGRLIVRASNQILPYDLAAGVLIPGAAVTLAQSGYPVAVSADGATLAAIDIPADFSAPPFLTVRGADGSPRVDLNAPVDQPDLGPSALAFSPTAPLLAVAYGGYNPFSGLPTRVDLLSADGQTVLSSIPILDAALNLAFSADGTRLIHDTTVGATMTNNIWDVSSPAALVPVASLPAPEGMMAHFMGMPAALDAAGGRAAVGYPDGSLSVFTLTPGAPTRDVAVQLFNRDAGEVVSAIAFSPDGSLLAIAGGVPFSGGLTGFEEFPILLVDSRTGVQIGRLAGHETLIRDLVFSADGRLLITAGDSTVRFWGVPGG